MTNRSSSIEEGFEQRAETAKKALCLLQAKNNTLLASISSINSCILAELRKRSKLGGIEASSKVAIALKQEAKVLETKLHTLIREQSTLSSMNSSLKAQINKLRKQKNTLSVILSTMKQDSASLRARLEKSLRKASTVNREKNKLIHLANLVQGDSRAHEQACRKKMAHYEQEIKAYFDMTKVVETSHLKRAEHELLMKLKEATREEEEVSLRIKLEELRKEKERAEQDQHSSMTSQAKGLPQLDDMKVIEALQRVCFDIESQETTESKHIGVEETDKLAVLKAVVSAFVDGESEKAGLFEKLTGLHEGNKALEAEIESLRRKKHSFEENLLSTEEEPVALSKQKKLENLLGLSAQWKADINIVQQKKRQVDSELFFLSTQASELNKTLEVQLESRRGQGKTYEEKRAELNSEESEAQCEVQSV